VLIAVVSDTHRRIGAIKKVIKKIQNADVLIHLGDNVDDLHELTERFNGKIVNVKGNCDFCVDVPNDRLIEIEGKRIFLTHGHRYGVKYDFMRLKYKALEVKADIVLFGHTHVQQIEYDEGILFINPGSPSMSRGAFNSIALIDIDENKVQPRLVEI
jgi:putative phosphoesterase